MRRIAIAIAVVAAALRALGACEGFGTANSVVPEAGAAPTTDGGDATTPPIDLVPDGASDDGACPERGPFLRVSRLDALSTGAPELRPTLSEDELIVVFERMGTIQIASRTNVAERFAESAEVTVAKGVVAGQMGAAAPVISQDGRRLVFTATVGVQQQLWLFERPSREIPFGGTGSTHRRLTELDGGSQNGGGSFSANQLYFSSSRTFVGEEGPFDHNSILVSELTGTGFSPPTNVLDDATEKPLVGLGPAVPADGRTLYFTRFVGANLRIFVADLADKRAKQIVKLDVPTVDGGPNGLAGMISPDRCRFYFAGGGQPNYDLFVAERR